MKPQTIEEALRDLEHVTSGNSYTERLNIERHHKEQRDQLNDRLAEIDQEYESSGDRERDDQLKNKDN
jgi:hypothetical protein